MSVILNSISNLVAEGNLNPSLHFDCQLNVEMVLVGTCPEDFFTNLTILTGYSENAVQDYYCEIDNYRVSGFLSLAAWGS